MERFTINLILPSRLIRKGKWKKKLKCLTMSKIISAFATISFIFLFFGAWLIGSLIVIQIDSEEFVNKKYEVFQARNRELQKNVGNFCRSKDKMDITRKSLVVHNENKNIQKYDDGKKYKANAAWENARKEKLIRENLVYFPDLKQMWCLVPKAASTTWSKAIVQRLNYESISIFLDPNSTDSIQVVLKKNFGNINRTTFVNAAKSETVQKILLVRHPFSRIASAYRDKLADRKAKVDGMHFFQQFGVRMNRKYRLDRKAVKQKEPTFQEFVDFLIDSKPLDLDEHWQPISLMCGLCHIRYDHFIRVEDLEETKELHLHKLGFPQWYKLPVENSGKYTSKDLFRNISNSKKIKLLEKYQQDFRLFQYSFLKHI